MPIFNSFQNDDESKALSEEGPTVDVKVLIPDEHAAVLLKQSGSVPKGRTGRVLIDTGSSLSAIDEETAKELSAKIIDSTSIRGATGKIKKSVYAIRLEFVGADLPPLPIVRCVGLPLSELGIIALIGREILRHYELVYSGPNGQIILAT